MEGKRTHVSLFLPACMIAVTTFLGSAVHATSLFPWENEHSVRALLTQQYQEGRTVVCEAAVDRVAARNNPPFFVLRDEFRASTDPESKIVVLCRPPLALGHGQAVRIQGVLGRLPNNELCILNATVECFVDQKTGAPIYWTPFPEFMTAANRQVLPVPTGPIPPSDPSLVDDGMGIPSGVSAYATQGVSRFDTVASLLATAPPLFTPVELDCKPVMKVGDGFIVASDDAANAAVKVYTNATVELHDRIIKLLGTAHSENGTLVIYADNGPTPYFDQQGFVGGVFVASPGTVAYAATLPDAGVDSRINSSGIRIMSVSPPSSSNGSWVYLTGQVITYVGWYYSYGISPNDWINVYDIQGVDRTPGIRVWDTSSGSSFSSGNIVDVMAKLDTKDGERLLGIVDTTPPYDYSSVECKILESAETLLPCPVGMNNRDLGGGSMGYNPGITGGQGLYNIGSYVTVWGKVLERGTYQSIEPYMVIDDGSGTPDDDQNVTVFGTNQFGWYDPVGVGDYVSVTGVSSVWQPSGSSDTFRCIWTWGFACNQANPPVTRQVTDTGTISGTVKLYDIPTGLPNNQVMVNVYCSSGQMATLTITRQSDGSGSGSYEFANVPKEINNYDQLEYIVSAKADLYKTRTYTGVAPWMGTEIPRNLYLTKLRKIYVTTNNTYIESCPGGDPTSTTITATVRDADHQPMAGVTVRFRTNKGSFYSSYIDHNYTPSNATNAEGQVQATLYGVPSEWGEDNVVVEATDDSAPLTGDNLNDDPYKYDWVQLQDEDGQSVNITVNRPATHLVLAANPTSISRCGEEMSEITATLTMCENEFENNEIENVVVHFTRTGKGVLTSATATTNAAGVATVHLSALDNTQQSEGIAHITAWADPYLVHTESAAPVNVEISHDKLILVANRYSVTPSQIDSTITAKLTTPSGTGIPNKEVTFTRTAGNLSSYSGTTNSSGEVSTTLSDVTDGDFAVVEATTTNRCNETIKQRCQVDFLQTAADDWPMFMRDTRHQGYSRTNDGTSISDFGNPVWTRPIDTAITATEQDKIWRANWDEGNHPNPAGGLTHIFEHPYIDSSPIHATDCPVIVGAWVGAVGSYLGTSKGYLAAFNPTTGDLQWDYPAGARDNDNLRLPGGISSTPAIAMVNGQKRVYFGCMDGKVYCLRVFAEGPDQAGSLVWSYQTKKRDNATAAKLIQSPTVLNDVVYIGNESARVYALNANDGTPYWTLPYDVPTSDLTGCAPDITGVSSIATANTAGENRLYFGCDNGYLYCLNASTKVKVWSYRPDSYYGCIESSPMIYAGNVYYGVTFFSDDFVEVYGPNLYAVNAASGEPVWNRRLVPSGTGSGSFGEEIRATCAAMDNAIYVGEDTGHYFYRLNAQTGETEPDQFPQNPSNPFYAGWKNYFVGSAALTPAGYGIVGNDNGKFYALTKNDLTLLAEYDTSSWSSSNNYVCSSPAISYAAQSGYKWVYIVSRSDDGRDDGKGTLYAFRQNRN